MYSKKYGRLKIISIVYFIILWLTPHTVLSREYSPNVHWVFCIDTSGSMKARGKLDLLNLITNKLNDEFIDSKAGILSSGDRITIFSFDENVVLEATAVYQTDADLLPLRKKLISLNKKAGQLTFTSEAILTATRFIEGYKKFFNTSALYIFTDGKSEPYSKKWPIEKIKQRVKRDRDNLNKISLAGKDSGMNIWIGVLKWDAYSDAKVLVKKIGKGGHLVDLTDFTRLSLGRAIKNFTSYVRKRLDLKDPGHIHFGTVPYKGKDPFVKRISIPVTGMNSSSIPNIKGIVYFDPDNPSELTDAYPVQIKTTGEKLVIQFSMNPSKKINAGIYRGRLKLTPEVSDFGTLLISPSEIKISFKKSGLISFYLFKVLLTACAGILAFLIILRAVKKRMPIRV